MDTIYLADKRCNVYRYDIGVLVASPEECTSMHFAFAGEDRAAEVPAEYVEAESAYIAKIPDFMLADGRDIICYAYIVIDPQRVEKTLVRHPIHVVDRPKPDDYVEPEDEPRWSQLEARVSKLEHGGMIDPKVIEDAVEKYLDEHPIEENDPTVPEWAKQDNKPTYTAEEVGALPDDTVIPPAYDDTEVRREISDVSEAVGTVARNLETAKAELQEEISEVKSGLETEIGGALRFDRTQALTDAQQKAAQRNIGIDSIEAALDELDAVLGMPNYGSLLDIGGGA